MIEVRGGQSLGYAVVGNVHSAKEIRIEAGETQRLYRREQLPKKAGVVEEHLPGGEMLLDCCQVPAPKERVYVELTRRRETPGTTFAACKAERLVGQRTGVG